MKWVLLAIVFVILLIAYIGTKKNKKTRCLKCNHYSNRKGSRCPLCGFSNKAEDIMKSGGGYVE